MAISKEIRVGAFVLAGLIVAGIVVFLIGDEKRLFESKVTFHTSFSDVQGLKTGAPVRLGGIDIGNVFRVEHSDDPSRQSRSMSTCTSSSARPRASSRTPWRTSATRASSATR